MDTQRYTIEVDADEMDAIRHHRAAKARPRPEARPNAKANPFWVLLLLVIVAALLGRVALDYATAFGLFTPPGWVQTQPTAQPLPTAAVARPAPRSAPVVVVPARYPPPRLRPLWRLLWSRRRSAPTRSPT